MRLAAIAAFTAAAALAGCGSGSEDEQTPSAAAPAPGGGLSVSEAIASDLEGPLLVRGYLIARDGELRLCEAILESQPPQCGEPSLRVEGTQLRASEEQASLLGEVANGVITVGETAIG